MMETYIFSLMILGLIILIKLIVIVCLYVHRLQRQRRMQELVRTQQVQSTGSGAGSYPVAPYNQRSAIVNYEEPVSVVPSNLNLQPPAYSEVVVTSPDKPPSYDQAIASPVS